MLPTKPEQVRAQFHRGELTQTVELNRETPLLDQALSAGLELPYGCRRGDCGDCLATLTSGDVAAADQSKPVTRMGKVLLCNALPLSDLSLRFSHSPETVSIKPIRSPAKIHQLQALSEDVCELTLRLPPAARFEYLAGQYVRLTNRFGISRSYSLALPPDECKLLRFHIRRVAGGAFSDYLFTQARPNDLLQLDGPRGEFFLRESQRAKQTLFLATGTGLAPIFAILSGLSADDRTRLGSLDLYWGNRTFQDAYGLPLLCELAKKLEIRVHCLFSRDSLNGAEISSDGTHVFFDQGYVQDHLRRNHPDLSDTLVLAAGNPNMIEHAHQECLALNLPSDRFYADFFTAS